MPGRQPAAIWSRFLATAAVALALGACLPLLAAETPPDPHRFDAEIARFRDWDRQNSTPRDATLFAGSSSIRLWPTAESFPHLPVINRGFGGAEIPDVLFFMDELVLAHRPAAIVFYAGDNDIAAGRLAGTVLADFQRFEQRVRQELPQAAIVFVSIKPSLARWNLWPEMRRANALVKAHCAAGQRLFYADVATPMLAGGGQPGAGLFVEDGLHLSAAGYALWNEVLGPLLDEALAPRDRPQAGAGAPAR
jgi:lysophospholipase L1-like esterase